MTSTLSMLLMRVRGRIKDSIDSSPHRLGSVVLFFSVTDGRRRAEVVTATGPDFASAWRHGVQNVYRAVAKKKVSVCWLRVDWVCEAERITWRELRKRFISTKRNYFRKGLSLDADFKHAFLETELNANAMLYGGGTTAHAVINENNFRRYALQKYNIRDLEFLDNAEVLVFSTRGAFVEVESPAVYQISGLDLDAGRRDIDHLTQESVYSLIKSGSDYLAAQVRPGGRFEYGWFPCFDRRIESYNSLRHASTIYAMLEAWEITHDAHLKSAIDEALSYLTGVLIKSVIIGDEEAAFLVDQNAEIKLGGNAVCILALVKYTDLVGSDKYRDLLQKLGNGILYMQNKESGKFRHVLSFPSLDIREEFRIIYYDGEAAFALMRLYGLSKDPRWLTAVERAFSYFISAGHWKAHDHWLSYSVNELTRYRPSEAYYQFGIQNFIGHLDFVIERITTFPTLLELMMAAQQMIARLDQEPDFRHLLANVDLEKFYRALHARAHYLLNGHFWPELAMFFSNPARIHGSFFIRHHGFRVRIDDVEHYLSGFVAYFKYQQALRASHERRSKALEQVN